MAASPRIGLPIDVPLAYLASPLDAVLIAAMAARLRRMNVPDSETEAVRALASGPFRTTDVARLAGAALALARQAGEGARR
jgi:hypothetical protein